MISVPDLLRLAFKQCSEAKIEETSGNESTSENDEETLGIADD